jgi:hypothetical protein
MTWKWDRRLCAAGIFALSTLAPALRADERWGSDPYVPPSNWAHIKRAGVNADAPAQERSIPLEAPKPAPPQAEALPPPANPEQPAQTGQSDQSPAVISGDEFDWSKFPPVRNPIPRLGWFTIPPDGPGFYSLLDLLRGNEREKPPKYPYPPISPYPGSFFDADYRYLDDPNNTQHDWLDCLKRIHLGDNLMFSTGGEFRYRLMDEQASRLTAFDNNYNLIRTRVYGDLSYRDRVRAYIEFIQANAFHESLPPLVTDNNPADILNLFMDFKLLETFGTPAYLRVGRQELLYGSQRLISPIDWANSRRTFQGVKMFWANPKWDVDMFWVKPVLVSATQMDSWDPKQDFFGLWGTYKPKPGTVRDFYVLNLANYRPVAHGANQQVGGFDITTFGTRWAGDRNGRWLYDAEGMIQTGIRANTEMAGYAYTVGLGYRFKDCRFNPTVWVYNDYASGDPNPGGPGLSRTFNQLFAFGHYYFGLQDFVGRQNINDLNVQASVNPTRWITGIFQYHHFTLAQPRDALYNTAGAPIRQDITGASGRYVGDEFDFTANVHCSQHADMWFGVGYFATGPFLENTGGPFRTPETFYMQYSYKW